MKLLVSQSRFWYFWENYQHCLVVVWLFKCTDIWWFEPAKLLTVPSVREQC